jgi:hypothetical protein
LDKGKNESKNINYSLKRKRRPTSKLKKDLKKLPKFLKNDDFEDSRNYRNQNDEDDDCEEDQVQSLII